MACLHKDESNLTWNCCVNSKVLERIVLLREATTLRGSISPFISSYLNGVTIVSSALLLVSCCQSGVTCVRSVDVCSGMHIENFFSIFFL